MKKPTKTKTDCERSRPALGHPWERLGFLWTCSQHEPIRRLPGDPEDLKRPGQRGRDVRTGHRHHPTPAPGPPAPLAPGAQTPASREQVQRARACAPRPSALLRKATSRPAGRPASLASSLPARTGVDGADRGGVGGAGCPVLPPGPALLPPSLSRPRQPSQAFRSLPHPFLTAVPHSRSPAPGLRVSRRAGGALRSRTRQGRPSSPAPRPRRRHGHEADAAHLLGPHAARGGSGLQRHHALWLFLNQRLQK